MTTGRINQVSEIQAPSRNCWEPGKIANNEIHKLAHPNFRPNTENSSFDALPQLSSHGLSRALPFTRGWDAATNVLPFIAHAMRNQNFSKSTNTNSQTRCLSEEKRIWSCTLKPRFLFPKVETAEARLQ